MGAVGVELAVAGWQRVAGEICVCVCVRVCVCVCEERERERERGGVGGGGVGWGGQRRRVSWAGEKAEDEKNESRHWEMADSHQTALW